MIYIYVLLILFAVTQTAESQIVINEVSASNYGLPYDDSMNSPDWIELYNSGDESVNLQNYHISDQRDISMAWRFPDVTLEPKEYMLVFASGKDIVLSDKTVIEASGHGVSDLEAKDEFRFDYIMLEGDFDLSMRVHSFTNAPLYATVGLMLRTNLTNNSKMVGIHCRQKERRYFSSHFRNETESLLQETHTRIKPDFPNCRIQFKREGDSVFTNVIDETGYPIERIAYYIPIQTSFYVGVSVSSADNKLLSKAVVSDIKLNNEHISLNDLDMIEFGDNVRSKAYQTFEMHTDFKVDRDSDAVYLFSADGSIVDSVIVNDLRANVTVGKFPDGSDNLKYFNSPTPGDTNRYGKEFICRSPEFSAKGGFFDSALELILTAQEPESKIFYTVDGSAPSAKSDMYTSPLLIDETTVVRAISVNEFGVTSLPETHTFFINSEEKLPVFSLSADPHLLFSKDSGLFHNDNLWPSRQIPMHFEFWENGKDVYSRTVEARLHGQVTRTYPQKSLRFYARNLYDTPEFKYDFFGENSLDEYEHILLRNGGSDWNEARIRDAFCNVFAKDFENLITTEYRPVTAFINGEYWGIYNLRERLNEDFLAEKYQVSEESINLMEQFDYLINGSSRSYYAIFDTLSKLDMTQEGSIVIISEMIDLENIVDYTIFNSFLGNFDWPFNNIKFFSSAELDGRWRWLLYDMDYTTGLWGTYTYNNVLERALDTDTSDFGVIMTSLLRNEKFKNMFINRFADLMNSKLLPENTVSVIDSIAAEFETEVERHNEQWPESIIKWDERIVKIKNFLTEKVEVEREYIAKQFELNGDYLLTLNSNIPNAASFEINSIKVESAPWEGYYFDYVPITIKVNPKFGKKFLRWSESEYGNSEEIIINANEDIEITAIFEDEGIERKIAINEIMYNAPDERDTKDWIELINYGDEDIDLSSWIVTDNNSEHTFTIPDGISIKSGEFLVLCREIEEFSKYHQDVTAIGDYDFGFGPEDAVKLFDNNTELVDIVEYTSEIPWYPEANGTGPSLELISPELDNSIPENWKISKENGGSPGVYNAVGSVANMYNNNVKVYPNPASDYINIKLDDSSGSESIEIIDFSGRTVDVIIDKEQNIKIDVSNYPSGIYYLKSNDSKSELIPFVIIN